MENGTGVPNGAGVPAAETAPTVPAVREQDRLMPIANVIRIMRRVLPPHAKISDEAKELIQECVSEFISFITGEANERCHAEHRKTVTAEDVVWAMDRLGFDDYVLPLTLFLQRMRACEAGGDGRAAAVATRAPPTNGVQVRPAVYAPLAPVHGYAVAMAPGVHATVVSLSPHVVSGGQSSVFGRERAVVPYYGEGQNVAYGAGSSRGGFCDEECSSNGVPVPAPGTGRISPAAELSRSNSVVEHHGTR